MGFGRESFGKGLARYEAILQSERH
jgi:hypothetical protein